MKHVFVLETVEDRTFSNMARIQLARALEEKALELMDGPVLVQVSANSNSAIRAVYEMFSADEGKSPNELGSAE